MTFDELTEIEPRLNDLRNALSGIVTDTTYHEWERTRLWYTEIKPQFKQLVGFMAENPEVNNCESYDTAYQEFCRVLEI